MSQVFWVWLFIVVLCILLTAFGVWIAITIGDTQYLYFGIGALILTLGAWFRVKDYPLN